MVSIFITIKQPKKLAFREVEQSAQSHTAKRTSQVKNPPANEGDAGDTGREDPPDQEMATGSSILAWKILQTEEPGSL